MTIPPATPTVPFHDGRRIPQLGLGVWQVADDVAAEVVSTAIDAGYRHIDTAAIYANERGVGEGIRARGVDRSDLFLTTKLWNTEHARDDALRAFEASCTLLGVDEVDLYLIHWPAPRYGRFVEAWAALVELHEAGRARSIGVSNFGAEDLERIVDATGVVPVINQVELHPYFSQRALRDAHARLGIVTESWSPLGQGGELLVDPVVTQIADAHHVTAAQIVLRWHVQHGLVTIPKSQNPGRIAANIDVFDFELTDGQLARLDALDRGAAGRIGPDPALAQF